MGLRSIIDYKIGLSAIFIISTIFSSCSYEKRMTRRMDRLCTKYPPLCQMESHSIDTIYKIRFTPRLDTVAVTRYLHDTIEVTNGDARARVIIRQDTIENKDTVLITLTQKPDTLIQIREKTVIKYKTRKTKWWMWVLLTLLSIRVFKWTIQKLIVRLE